MKQFTTLLVLSFLLLISACKKETIDPVDPVPAPVPEQQYMIRVKKSSKIFREYVYTPTKLVRINFFDTNEIIATTAFFEYKNNILKQSALLTSNGDSIQTQTFNHNAVNQVSEIIWERQSNFEKRAIVEYSGNSIQKVKWEDKNYPFHGIFFVNTAENVHYYENNFWNSTPVGSGQAKQKNNYTFDVRPNPLSQFWVYEPSTSSISKHNPITQTQTTETYVDWGNGSGGEWYTSNNNWSFQYIYNNDDLPLSKTTLDSNGVITVSLEYEYIEL